MKQEGAQKKDDEARVHYASVLRLLCSTCMNCATPHELCHPAAGTDVILPSFLPAGMLQRCRSGAVVLMTAYKHHALSFQPHREGISA